jgi:hypothetical protein
MPDCLIRGVRSVDLGATNFEEAHKFYEGVWNLRPVEARDGARLYRGTWPYHHILGLHRGARPAVIRIAFDVVDRKAVDALYRAVVASGCRHVSDAAELPAAIGGGYGFGCKDPDGRNLASCPASPISADAKGRARLSAQDRTSTSQCPRLRRQPAVLHRDA